MEIDDSEPLLRRVHANHIDPDGRGMWLAFRGAELSVDRERLRSVEELGREYPARTVARLFAGPCRAAGFLVDPDPTPDNPAHALIRSSANSRAEERRLAMILRDLSKWPAT